MTIAARSQRHAGPSHPAPELAGILGAFRAAFVGIGLVSGLINVLMLTGSFYMLEIYDRVLTGRSIPTLVGISILAAILYVFLGMLGVVRGRMLARIAVALDLSLAPRLFDSLVRMPLQMGRQADGLQPLRDLDSVRSFMSGLGPTALFDLPWMPVYFLICFAFHPWLGMAAIAGALVLVAIMLMTEWRTRAPTRTAAEFVSTRNAIAEASVRNAEVLQAMGMSLPLAGRWHRANADHLGANLGLADVVGGFGEVSKIFRMMLQSAILGVGAWLVIRQEASAGVIIASSILTARALAPVDVAIAHWRGFMSARQSWQRLNRLLTSVPPLHLPTVLPPPTGLLTVENLSVGAPGTQRLIVTDMSFVLRAGAGLGVIGPSASGKSSLARALVGVWEARRGAVRFDGASFDQWHAAALGRHIGYLPQDVELIDGTIAENIARFDPLATSEAVVTAAKAAGVHDLVVALPQGYDTAIGEQGCTLSAGQRQRIALARALYGDPFLVVLDEPNSNLDAEGEEALTQAIRGVRARGGIAVVIAHRPGAIAGVDLILAMRNGRMHAFGPKDDVLRQVLRREPPSMRVISESGGGVP